MENDLAFARKLCSAEEFKIPHNTLLLPTRESIIDMSRDTMSRADMLESVSVKDTTPHLLRVFYNVIRILGGLACWQDDDGVDTFFAQSALTLLSAQLLHNTRSLFCSCVYDSCYNIE